MPRCYILVMRILVTIMFIVIFLCSGVSSLPACYATKLDCEQKNTNNCPFSGGETLQGDEELPPCHMFAQKKEGSTATTLPLEHFQRLKIEQIQQNVIVLPGFIPLFSTSILLEVMCSVPVQKYLAGVGNTPHNHPPPLFIQHQSFLI